MAFSAVRSLLVVVMLVLPSVIGEGGGNKRDRHGDDRHGGSGTDQQDCQQPVSCSAADTYRSIDGSCNNLKHSTWGQASRTHRRVLNRDDSRNPKNNALPSARIVTNTILSDATENDFSNRFSLMMMLWGQFLDHDLTETPQTNVTDCCGQNSGMENCIPIEIPPDDPAYPDTRTCMEVKRSLKGCGEHLKEEQVNSLTSYIDASGIYGSSDAHAKELRTLSNGRMKMSDTNLLPTKACPLNSALTCFVAGDERANEWMGLTSFHHLLVLEHNRIATELGPQIKASNSNLNDVELDEKIYQETRRIIGALMQVITYNEFLPEILGKKIMDRYNLPLRHNKYKYNDAIDATISNVFATAAFRFGHSLVPFDVRPKDRDYLYSHNFVPLQETLLQPSVFMASGAGTDNTLRGVATEPALDVDEKFSREVRHKLFENSLDGNGLDLPAINIQRGRDHGLPPYNEWRRECGLHRISHFKEMSDHNRNLRERFQNVYKSVDDIDLYVAAVTEKNVTADAAVGPTFACILGREFQRFKEGDRFWFENEGNGAFCEKQIEKLRKIKLSRIICDNTDSVRVPEKALLRSDTYVSCSNTDVLPSLELKDWYGC